MSKANWTILAAAAALTVSPASAQLPNAKVLTFDVAHALAQEALAKCRADGYKVTVLVVDGMNAPKAMVRDDGASAATTEVAKMKATATMLYNRPSGPAQPLPPGTAAPPATVPGTINAQGGVPIKVGDYTIGAIAVSGAPGGDKDAACANAALTKLAERLR
ncbi:MAG: heme-binding protein [Acidobacteriia bacterium]|nr:heme-binding protein [Terriglobia bacterium]MBV8905445.1 heme-binding protein [Terriglobia bacterium]MBV9746701.1 heme-binding protein [Terriglobia bacterium]